MTVSTRIKLSPPQIAGGFCKINPGTLLRHSTVHNAKYYTEKCRFIDISVREISRFFVAPRREFAPAVWRISRTLLSRNTSTLVLERSGRLWSDLTLELAETGQNCRVIFSLPEIALSSLPLIF